MEDLKSIIEIGSFSIKTVIFSDQSNETQIKGVGKSNANGFDGTNVISFDDFVESIKKSIVQAEKQANYIIRETYILLSNNNIKIRKI